MLFVRVRAGRNVSFVFVSSKCKSLCPNENPFVVGIVNMVDERSVVVVAGDETESEDLKRRSCS